MALKELYTNEVVPAMMKEFGYKNALEVPKVEKVVISMGVGEATQNPDALEDAVKDPVSYTHLDVYKRQDIC